MLADHIEGYDAAPSMRGGLRRLSELSNIIFDAVIADDSDDSDDDLITQLGGRKALGKIEEGGVA